MLKILEIFDVLRILRIRDSSFIDRSLTTASVAVIPANPYFCSKSAENDVTLMSFTADLL